MTLCSLVSQVGLSTVTFMGSDVNALNSNPVRLEFVVADIQSKWCRERGKGRGGGGCFLKEFVRAWRRLGMGKGVAGKGLGVVKWMRVIQGSLGKGCMVEKIAAMGLGGRVAGRGT